MINLNRLLLESKKQYLIVDSEGFGSDNSLLDFAASFLEQGAKIIQLKCAGLTARKIIELGAKLKQLCSIYDALFIVEDRVDVAFSIGASGVLLSQESLSVHQAREILGESVIVGVSVIKVEQALEAVHSGVDYLIASVDNLEVDKIKSLSENKDILIYFSGSEALNYSDRVVIDGNQ